ncbi:uncharacterized protein CBL_07019 [Carabus blaptoides fortunei]
MLKNEEEFNNFMHKVTEVSEIVKKLSSDNQYLNEIGQTQADCYLNDTNQKLYAVIDDQQVQLKVKCDKTLINKVKEEPADEGQMSQEAFMREVEKDAKKRFEDKKIRKEKSDTLKIQANKAYRRGEYERALSLYNKAIELIRDSCTLYINRALTYMQLKFYEKAIKDCETALKLNESCLKAWLYLAKAYYKLDDQQKSDECIAEALKRNQDKEETINDYVHDYKSNNTVK